MIDEHAAAFLALLNAAITSPHLVFDGVVANLTDPKIGYTVVQFDSGDPEFDFEAKAWQFVMTATIHSVGANAQAARQMGDLARSALIAVVPTIANRSCWPITREDGSPPQRDESTGYAVFDQADVYVLRSVPG